MADSILIDPAILYWGTPVVLVSTVNEDKSPNLAPMSSAWWLGWGCMLGFTESAKSVKNLRRTGDCVLNLPSSYLADAVDRIAMTTGNNPVPPDKAWLGFEHVADKFGRAGLTPISSKIVSAPRAAECDVQMEATVEKIHAYGATNPGIRTKIAAIELRIVAVHVNPNIVHKHDTKRINPDLWRPLIMNFREFYGLGDRLVPSKLAEVSEELWRPRPQQ